MIQVKPITGTRMMVALIRCLNGWRLLLSCCMGKNWLWSHDGMDEWGYFNCQCAAVLLSILYKSLIQRMLEQGCLVQQELQDSTVGDTLLLRPLGPNLQNMQTTSGPKGTSLLVPLMHWILQQGPFIRYFSRNGRSTLWYVCRQNM